LRQHDRTLADIATEAGFADQGHMRNLQAAYRNHAEEMQGRAARDHAPGMTIGLAATPLPVHTSMKRSQFCHAV